MDSSKNVANTGLGQQILNAGATIAYNKAESVLKKAAATDAGKADAGKTDGVKLKTRLASLGLCALQVTGEALEARGIVEINRDSGKPPQPPYDPSKDANSLYEAMHGGFLGAGTDEEAIYKALQGKSPEQVEKLKAHYKDHYGKDLEGEIRDEMSGDELSRAMNLMKGDENAAAVDAVHYSVSGPGTDEETIYNALKNKTPEQMDEIKKNYKEKFGRTLEGDLRDDMSGAELDRALALIRGDNAGADAAQIKHAVKGLGTDEDAIYQALEGKSDEDRAAIIKAYKEQYGVNLDADLKDDMSGAELDWANALKDGNKAAADAARVRHALNGIGTDEDGVWSTLDGADEKHRAEIAGEYKKLYCEDLVNDLDDDFSGNEQLKTDLLLKNGKLTDGQKLHFAMDGWGTDEDAIKETLADRSKSDVANIRKEYKEFTGKKLDDSLVDDLSGSDLFYAQLNLRGDPENPEEAMERMEAVYQYERGGSSAFSRNFMDTFNNHGKLLDRNHERALEYYGKTGADGVMTKAEEDRVMQLSGYVKDDADTYKSAKESGADTLSMAAGLAAGAAVTVATGGGAAGIVAGIVTAGASRTASRYAVLDNTYSASEGATDFALGAFDGATAALGGSAGSAVARKMFTQTTLKTVRGKVSKAALKKGLSTVLNQSTKPEVSRQLL